MAADAPDPDREIASVIAAKISSIRFDPDPASEWAEAMPAVAIAESRAASAAAARARASATRERFSSFAIRSRI